MKFQERLHRFFARLQARASVNCIKARHFARFILWHTCWCSLIVGVIILTVGILLRVKLINTSNVQLVESSGLFFIVIGIFLIVLSPLIAVYELSHMKKRVNQGGSEHSTTQLNDIGGGDAIETVPSRLESRGDLPTYDEIITAKSSNGSTRYPRRLDVDSLSNSSSAPMPPAYNEVARTESIHSKASLQQQQQQQQFVCGSIKSDEVATIAPSSQTDANKYIRRST